MKLNAKILLYVGIGYLTPLIPSLSALNKTTMAEMLWPQWVVLGLTPVLSVLITLKALASDPKDQTTPPTISD